MIKYLKYTLIIALICTGIMAKAQYALKLADEQYNLYNFYNAADLYEKAYKKTPTLYAATKLASSYHLMQDYKNEESWYATAIATNGSIAGNMLNYAQALQNNSKFSEAKVAYSKYASLNNAVSKAQLNTWLASCDSAMQWMQNPTSIIITNQQALNGKTSDWGAVKYNGNIFFASDRFDTPVEKPKTTRPFLRFDGSKFPDKNIYGWTGNGYLKVYQSNSRDSVSLFPMNVKADYHTGPVVFSADGSEMYFTVARIADKIKKDRSGTQTVKLEIYSSRKDAVTSQWATPLAFKYNNINSWSAGDPFLTADGMLLYFVSDMPGGKGGTDIYYCVKDADGSWLQPINATALNTAGNERTPVIHNNTVYYASDGGITMGGLDIMKADITANNGYANIANMGYPINSPQDDFAFVFTGNDTGYLSSNRTGGRGSDDIYSFTNKPAIVLRLVGIVYDKSTHETLINSIVTLSKANSSPLKVQTDATGSFKFNLEQQSDYNLLGEKTNYRSDAETVSTMGLATSQVITKDLFLERIAINKPILLKNINYDFDKAKIRADAKVELDKLIKVMNDNPTIWIELGSHTDSRGSDAYNMALSQRRAQAAVNYITTIGGISINRISAKGYGESRLLNGCANGVKCTDAEHEVNRRTEFTIVKQ